jgi:hypothetical protein
MLVQAYQAFQLTTMQVPLHSSIWDTMGLMQALHASSLQQLTNQSDWYMDSNASSHMTSEQGNLSKVTS